MKSPILLLICAVSFGTVAQAADIGDFFGGLFNVGAYSNISASNMANNLDVLNARDQRSLLGDLRWAAANPKEYESCQKQYSSFYRDGILDISLTMGYLDMPDRTIDEKSFNMIYGALTRECSYRNEMTCGFEETDRVYENRVVLEKAFNHDFGGVGMTPQQRIRVTLTYTAASTNDSDNVTSRGPTPEQLRMSRIAEASFFGGIGEPGLGVETCDVCGYLGHARDGGGPDFRPVPLAWRKADGHTDYTNYQAKRTNFRRLLNAINSSTHSSRQLVAIMGCNSAPNFAGRPKRCLVDQPGCAPLNLKNFESRTGFILTDELSWPQNQSKYLAILLDGVINMKCRSAWTANFAELMTKKKDTEVYRIHGNFLR